MWTTKNFTKCGIEARRVSVTEGVTSDVVALVVMWHNVIQTSALSHTYLFKLLLSAQA